MGKLQQFPFLYYLLASILFSIGLLALYSASHGNAQPFVSGQLQKFILGSVGMLICALMPLRFWFSMSYFIFIGGLGLLAFVKLFGVEGGLGAQRWLNIAGFQFQPSEFMKIAIVLALARYFHNIHNEALTLLRTLIVPACLIGITALFILAQPNLGTTVIVCFIAASMLFAAGIGWKKFFVVGLAALVVLPIAYTQLHDYQKQRVQTFLNPEADPLGTGYNIIQSKIAVGSGGITGKGFLQGTQSQLSFVPEKHTDFIFTVIAEEWGFLGACLLLFCYLFLLMHGLFLAESCGHRYGRLVIVGLVSIIFFHVMVNIGMVIGLLPVVGVPLPFLSYGGSHLLALLLGIGLVANMHINRQQELPKQLF